MVRPAAFGFNPETAESNAFQKLPSVSASEVSTLALSEFDRMVEKLIAHDVDVTVVDESGIKSPTTDSVFPNNVFSTHPNGTLCWYPMQALARRKERNLLESCLTPSTVFDMTLNEEEGQFLEGTGSLILDHEAKLAFACRSSRTDEKLVREWCAKMGFQPVIFDAVDSSGKLIYHTNVMMCLGHGFAVVNLESIVDGKEKEVFTETIKSSRRELVEIDNDNMEAFAGNMLEILNKNGQRLLLMSKTAHSSLNELQIKRLEALTNPLWFEIPTIEQVGGGSVRCMVAELFF